MRVVYMDQRGIGLIIIIISIAIILLLAGSGLYFSSNGQKSVREQGKDAIQQAEDLRKIFEAYDEQIEIEIDR
ncbi:hypothetical protein IID24_04300 [Patescibacteria group bacterium]|nr:hypothetical protein [Patescibacteria group bacterium]